MCLYTSSLQTKMTNFVPDARPCIILSKWRGQAPRRVWEEAFGPVPHGMQVLHHCDNGSCRELSHLFLGTQSDNIRDAVRKGRWTQASHRKNRPKGDKHHNSKITPSIARYIRENYAPRIIPLQTFASQFGISISTVYQIVSGRTWTD